MTSHHSLLIAFAIINFLTTLFLSVSARLSVIPNFSYAQQSVIPNLSSTDQQGPWDTLLNLTNAQPGKTYKGISDVKKYFHQFGYIPNTNFTDDFDDSLVSAIRTFQTNYKLNLTGELDINTLQHMVQPRCGVADVVHSENEKSSSHFHAVEHFVLFDGSPRWPVGTQSLTYAFWDNLNPDVKSVFASAFSKWAPVVGISFQETVAFFGADIRIGFFRRDHGDGFPFDGPAGVLAHSSPPTDGSFHLDAEEDWWVSGDITKSPVQRAADLETVAVHEIGHLLGLAHSYDKNAIMYPYILLHNKKVDLTDDDIQGIRKLYGK